MPGRYRINRPLAPENNPRIGPEAINDRLILIETVSFTTTPDEMLEALTRIIADRPVGQVFFGNDHLMDFCTRDRLIERRPAHVSTGTPYILRIASSGVDTLTHG